MGSEPFEVGYFERLAEFVKGLGVQLKKKKKESRMTPRFLT